jgi:2-amino-4-hydroxy-6-hydroxymethyldihydropteridine diphosphokinase
MAAVRADLGYGEIEDETGARLLRRLLPRDDWPAVAARLAPATHATVIGCGPDLARTELVDISHGVVVACDGATARMRELDAVPDLVVTDLDGDPEALLWAAEAGAAFVVHAHGDNLDALPLVRRLLAFGAPVAGTLQVAPKHAPLRNFGGFTDGDRAVLMLEHLGFTQVRLVAFDYDALPSAYSHRYDPALKRRKLAWARRLIGEAEDRGLRVRYTGRVTSLAQRA